MKYLILAVSVLALLLLGATSISNNTCSPPQALINGYDTYFSVGARDALPMAISFEPDANGAGATAVMALEFCSREQATACQPYNFDSNADGLGDTNLLDGSTIEKSGLQGIAGFRYLRVTANTAPGVGELAEFTICRTTN